MRTNATALIIGALMTGASFVGVWSKPAVKLSSERTQTLAMIVPKQFGDWREEPQRVVQVVNPQAQELLDKLYSEILTRVYVNAAGYRVMLSLAYGTDQRGSLQVHKPEVCYPAQGFVVKQNEPAILSTRFGPIPVRRLYTTMSDRHEPVTYWLNVGDEAVQGALQKRLVEIRLGLTGRIPDGMLFRVSSIDADKARAYRYQEEFVNDLLESVTPSARKRLSGLGPDL